MRRPLVVIAAASIGVLSACSSSSHSAATAKSQAPVVVGSANFPENEVLADIYADALRKAGVPVTSKLDIGSREVYFKEMENGTLNVFPEYNGALLDYLDATATASSTADVDSALASKLPASLETLRPAAAQDSDSVTVTSAFAAAHNIKSISDLVPVQSQVTIGAAPEFQNRQVGLLGLQRIYGLTLKFKPLDESGPLTIAALNAGSIQAADIYTTDPSVAKYHFVSLADPKHLFPAQNVIPIVNKSVATQTVVNTLNAVSNVLTTAILVQLVGGVVNSHADPATVAAQFVSQEHLG